MSISELDKLNGRFKSAIWYEPSKKESIYLVGLGGIGSNFLYSAIKTIPCKYYIQDFDTVEDINVATQFYRYEDIGQKKSQASRNIARSFNPLISDNIISFNKKYDGEVLPITVAALDNMATRKEMYEEWKKLPNRELFLEARLRANFYEVYAVTPETQDKYENTLFNDDEVESAPCTYKATAYFGLLVGARMTHLLVNYLSNKYSEEPIYTLPFSIKEFGDLFYIEID